MFGIGASCPTEVPNELVNLVFIFCNLEHFFVFANLKTSLKFPGINMTKHSTSLKFSAELRLAAG